MLPFLMQKKLSFIAAKIAIEQLLGQHDIIAHVVDGETKAVFFNAETEARFYASDWMTVYREVLTYIKSIPNATA